MNMVETRENLWRGCGRRDLVCKRGSNFCRNTSRPGTNAFDKNIFDFTIDAIQPAMTMAGFPEAVNRISHAIDKHQAILIVTDYDVDGCTFMAILCNALHQVFGVPASDIVQLTGHRMVEAKANDTSVGNVLIESLDVFLRGVD